MTVVFGQPWWLEAITPGAWGEATVARDGRVVARLPWGAERLGNRRVGIRRAGCVTLTPRLPLWVEEGDGKYDARLARRHKLLDELIDQLPAADLTTIILSPGELDVLPFIWRGFQANVRYTYRLDDLRDLDAVWAGCNQGLRNAVRKARQQVEVVEDHDVERMWGSVTATFARQDERVPYRREHLERIVAATLRQGAGDALSAVDEQGRTHASLFVVGDEDTAYYLIGGADPELRSSNAQSLLVWEAITRAASRGQAFDFEGSMVPGIARFFRSFGASQQPCIHLLRHSRRMRAALAVKDLAEAIRR